MNLLEEICQVCEKPKKKLLYTICSHMFCLICREKYQLLCRYYSSFHCPICKKSLKEEDIQQKDDYFKDDLSYRMEIQVRDFMKLEFNETLDDFENSNDFLNYQELVEDLIEMKLNKQDENKINSLIRKYRLEKNQRKIVRAEKERQKAMEVHFNKKIDLDTIDYPTIQEGIKSKDYTLTEDEEKKICGYESQFWNQKQVQLLNLAVLNNQCIKLESNYQLIIYVISYFKLLYIFNFNQNKKRKSLGSIL